MSMVDQEDQQRSRNVLANKWLIAKVEDNQDPKKLQRVRISIPEVIEGPIDQLPWAIPFTLPTGGMANVGGVNVPEVGAAVYVLLQDGDKHYPVYFGSAYDHRRLIDLFATNYPNRYGYQDSKQNWLYVDKTSGDVEIHHHSGTQIHIADNGEVTINVAANEQVTVAGDLTINVNGSTSLTSGGDVTVSAPTVRIN